MLGNPKHGLLCKPAQKVWWEAGTVGAGLSPFQGPHQAVRLWGCYLWEDRQLPLLFNT